MTWEPRNREEKDSQFPAIELMRSLGWGYVAPEDLLAERAGIQENVLLRRLEEAIRRVNPEIPDDAVKQMLDKMGNVSAPSLLEANEKVHNLVTFGYDYKPSDGSHTVTYHFVDYHDLDNNEWLCTIEYKVDEAIGESDKSRFDIVCFVNGIPIVVVENKDPLRKDAVMKGVRDLVQYQERVPTALYHSEPLISMAGTAGARAGVVGAEEKFYAKWKDPWPMVATDLQDLVGRDPTGQDRLIAGKLEHQNLLDLIHNFVVFEATGDKRVKKMARDYQFRAVHKTLLRLEEHLGDAGRSGGVIHHTQGSGKSLTMLFLAMKLKQARFLSRPTIVVLTDRKNLDKQITENFRRAGYGDPEHAKRSDDLKTSLPKGGVTVTTTIQKFLRLEPGGGKKATPLNESKEVIVLVDEGHRTQYNKLRRLVRETLPNATYVAFTGTPIDKKDRSTVGEFGGILDRYTREESIEDGNTLPIIYERRKADEALDGVDLEAMLERYYPDYDEATKEKIRRAGATETVVASAPRRIEQTAADILDHFREEVQPNGFKGMIVARSREAALQYRLALDEYGFNDAALIITKSKEDTGLLFDHRRSIPDESEYEDLIERFKQRDDPLALLIVCDMLLTGFDAPVLQAMYFDTNLREHNLLQALDRVNRPTSQKKEGFFIDYWGVTEHLADALEHFDEVDIEQVKRTVSSKKEKLQMLVNAERAALRYFDDVDDLAACVAALGPDDVRADFEYDFRNFSHAFDILKSEPGAGKHERTLKRLAEIRAAARDEYDDDELDISHCRERIKKLIHDHLISRGVEVKTDRVKVTAQKIREAAKADGSLEAVAVKMRHKVRRRINVALQDNPKLYQRLDDRLKQIIRTREEKAENAQWELDQLASVIAQVEDQERERNKLGLNPMEYTVYNHIEEHVDGKAKALAHELLKVMEDHAAMRDWRNPTSEARRLMRQGLKMILYEPIQDKDVRDAVVTDLVDVAARKL